ncbi:MAG: FAD:protein FMN transferase [Clostridia bacterium]|nr:FAD:protein FMN transferase [Clostridia bacterium]
MRVLRSVSLLVCACLIAGALLSCASPSGKEPQEPKTQAKSYYEYFDTVSTVLSYAGDSADTFYANCDAVSEILQEYHRLLDIYYEHTGINNLKTVNRNAGVAPVKVDRKLIDFLLYAKEIYALTNGATNIAMGSVLKLWHDAREKGIDDPQHAYLPSDSDLAEAAKHTDINSLVIDEAAGTVFLTDPLMRLDVGAIGKGYATERAAELLIARGVSAYVLNIGGNIRAIGAKTSGRGWSTGITNPDKTAGKEFVCTVEIKDTSLVTSGDYERYFVVGGVRYHHIIDPKTNQPAAYFSSVSVQTKDGGLADALSTALFCMSYEEGLALINGIGGVEVVWVGKDGTVKLTNGITRPEG